MALGMTAGCPVRMSEKHLRFVIGPAASGICHVSQVPLYHSQKAPFLAHAHLAPGCHAQRPHYRSREDSMPLDRTGKMTADLWGGRGSGYLNLTGTRSYFRRV
ncbi:unnamed protein product, partial [Staurois parvus]